MVKGNFLWRALGAAAIAAIGSAIVQPGYGQTTVTFASFGGTTQEAEVQALFGDSAKLGATIRNERSGFWSGIKAYLNSGASGWDLTSIGFARCEEAAQSDHVVPMDYSIIDKSKSLPELVHQKYIGIYTFGYGIAYQKKKYGANPPNSWADFWDVKKFPGRRSLFADGTYALEVALMADGVPMKDVYKVLKAPGGVDRAFAKLAQIKPNIAVWWRSTGQAQQLLRDGEVDMIMIPNARAEGLVKAGSDVGYVWNQGIIDTECFLVPKTAPNQKLAMKLINSSLDPKNQAAFALRVGYGPVNPKAFDEPGMTPAEVAWLPSAKQNLAQELVADPTWYASKEADAAYQRFGKFLQ
jgi:putative spermidine/putrescine transport system substrate-binding protein